MSRPRKDKLIEFFMNLAFYHGEALLALGLTLLVLAAVFLFVVEYVLKQGAP